MRREARKRVIYIRWKEEFKSATVGEVMPDGFVCWVRLTSCLMYA